VRLLISLAELKGWDVHHMNIKSAFVNDDLHDEAYVNNEPFSSRRTVNINFSS
jgi:hypothetical protein